MSFDIWLKWRTSPVIVSIAKNPVPVWEIPFPAITICPESKVNYELFNFTTVFRRFEVNPDNVTREELKKLEALSQVCLEYLFQYDNISSGLSSAEMVSILKSLKVNLLLTIGEYYNKFFKSEEVLAELLGGFGVCSSYNLLDFQEMFKTNKISKDFTYKLNYSAENWTLEDGYSTKDTKTYPRRVFARGLRGSTTVFLNQSKADLGYVCNGPDQGYRFFLHAPNEIPPHTEAYFIVPHSKDVIVNVKAKIVKTDDTLKDYDPKRRGCYYNHERSLKFAKFYTQSNCELECMADFLLKKLGCVGYSMPRDESTRVCNQTEIFAMLEAKSSMDNDTYQRSLDPKEDDQKDCNCLPSCTSIKYDVELSHSDFDVDKVLASRNFNLTGADSFVYSRVSIYFKNEEFLTMVRSEIFGFADFLASVGGLLGMCLGMSIFSMIEIFYYLAIRPKLSGRREARQRERLNLLNL